MTSTPKPNWGVCPDMPKGKPCPVCGATYVCLRWREKPPAQQPPKEPA